ncbi:SAM-dependent methyltransferase [Bdellovibrio sp. HCB337]|uniref:SAM-dependent methyltransferase n=1 Tax=Bdellovibrio sp. HCB337 TaxID=3394358 RepID=UPI0039A44223
MFAYLAFENFSKELEIELKNKKAVSDRLFVSDTLQKPIWAQHIWYDCEILEVQSIGDAVKELKSRGKWWALYSFDHHRRAQLVQEQLPKFKVPPLKFMGEVPTQPMGAWTMLEKNKILVAAKTSSPFPLGDIQFQEDKETPPSRAYLKLWELLTVHGLVPAKGSLCMDLGSCPGGWTWVLQQSGAKVISVDKAPLDPKIAKLPNIEYRKKDAFVLKPEDIGKIDWLFSDIICYPPRLLELVQEWRASGLCKNFVCTIKFQGDTDWETMERFLEIPNSRIIHLCHNKHEVTWICVNS